MMKSMTKVALSLAVLVAVSGPALAEKQQGMSGMSGMSGDKQQGMSGMSGMGGMSGDKK